MPTFVREFLDLTSDLKLGKQLAKTFKPGVKRDALLKLLGDRIEPNRIPAWLTWNTGNTSLDMVGHLGEPLFCAMVADEDEFYGEPTNELVLAKSGSAQRIVDGEDTDHPKLKDADVAKLTAYDGEGFLLGRLTWVGQPPTIKDARKLLATAYSAVSGDLTAYERAEPETAKAKAKADVPVAPATMTALFLGDPARTGNYPATVTRKVPKLVWSSMGDTENRGCESGGNPVIDESLGLIFAGDYKFSAKVSATRIEDGKTVWKVTLTKNQSWITGDAVVADGVLYQVTNKNVFALDAKTGKQKWMATVSGCRCSPVVVGDVVIVGSGDGVLALSIDKGRKKWLFKVERDDVRVGVRGGFALADGVLYFTAEEKLFAVEVATQRKLWTIPANAQATPCVAGDTVFVWAAGILAVDRATGKQRWLITNEKLGKQRGYFINEKRDADKTFAVAGNRLLTRACGRLTAFDTASGKKKWAIGLDKPYGIGSAGPAVAGDVALCILVDDTADNRTLLYAVDIPSGKLLWSRKDFPEKARLSWDCTPAIGSDGTVYVQAYGLHALK